jgi:hypothetical protein
MPLYVVILALAVVGSGLVNAFLMIYDPRLWIEKVNAFYRLFMGKTPWFQLSGEGLKSPVDCWCARVVGLLLAYYTGYPFFHLLPILFGGG